MTAGLQIYAVVGFAVAGVVWGKGFDAVEASDAPGADVACEVSLFYGKNCHAGFWHRKFEGSLGKEEGFKSIDFSGLEENEPDSVKITAGCHKVEFWDEDGDRQGYGDNFIVHGATGKGYEDRRDNVGNVGGDVKSGWCFNLPYDLEEDLGGLTVYWLGQCWLKGSKAYGSCSTGWRAGRAAVAAVGGSKVVVGSLVAVLAVAALILGAVRMRKVGDHAPIGEGQTLIAI